MKILITGGHSGMGLALTKRLLAEGHHLGLIVRTEHRKSEAQKLFSQESNITFFTADLSKRQEVEHVVAEVQSTWEYLDGIFNNAGVLLDQLYFSDYGNELQLEINAISPYLLIQALLPLLEKAQEPFVVSTATGTLDKKKLIDIPAFQKPKKFTKLMGSYMDSKITMVALMNYLAKQHDRVRFVHVDPGAIKTKMTSGSGMPWLLKPIRNILFKSPEYGAENLYKGAFGENYQKSGLYISGQKVRPIRVEITVDQINELIKK